MGDRLIFARSALTTGTCYFYNAGMDPAAKDVAGMTGPRPMHYELAPGCRRFDFLRGGESYKYEWGAVDEPIDRLAGPWYAT